MAVVQSDDPIKAERVQQKVSRLRGWEYQPHEKPSQACIARAYTFPTFLAAIRFVDYVAEVAEAADHHPDIDIRYNQVTLRLSTHSAGGITEKDFALVGAIDQR